MYGATDKKTTIQITVHINDVPCNMQPMGKINKMTTVQTTYVKTNSKCVTMGKQ